MKAVTMSFNETLYRLRQQHAPQAPPQVTIPKNHSHEVRIMTTPRGSGAFAPGTRNPVLNDFLFPNQSRIDTRVAREFLCTALWLWFGFLLACNPYTDAIWAPAVGFALPMYVIYEVQYGTAANPMLSLLGWIYNQHGEAPYYYWLAIAAQVSGSLVAGWAAKASLGTIDFNFAVMNPWPNVSDVGIIVTEGVVSFGFAWLYHLIYRIPPEGGQPIVVVEQRGLVLAAYWFIAIAATNSCLHPLRAVSACIVAGTYSKLYLYIVAQFMGYVTAGIAFVLFYGQKRV